MNQTEAFGSAAWLGGSESDENKIYVLRGKFELSGVKSARLRVLGLGIFHCYLNGKRVGNDLFLPLNTEFEPRENFPKGEVLTAHRIYVPEYDVTELLKDGTNVIAIHFGGGWYTYSRECAFGEPKAIWYVFGEDEKGKFTRCSSERDKISNAFVAKHESVVKGYSMSALEEHDYRRTPNALDEDFDDADWGFAALARAPKTEYDFSDCPQDRVKKTIVPKEIYREGGVRVFDVGENTTGYPVLKLNAKEGEHISVTFSEELLDGKRADAAYNHMQAFGAVSDGKERTVRPLFCWYGFRYFELTGDAEVLFVEVVHTDVEVTSSFESSDEILNWIYETYVHTQLVNMHTGIPSDCPHMERRGYTGDGQLVCHAAMNTIDSESFYRKWMQDISDSQDSVSGHVQYTAPYTHSGGGPGGWGSAVVEVPFQFYRHFGDVAVLKKYYPAMLRYFDYLEEHSECGLVTSDKEGEWCLGDWCTPEEVILPAPFVNNYFYVKSLSRAITIANLIGREGDVPELKRRIAERKSALLSAYFNKWDGNFLGAKQGANAFMLDIGLGDERTYKNLVAYYEKLGGYDTGIFGTDVVTRILFERGDTELAVRLLTSRNVHSFAEMKKRGATTLLEYWPDSRHDRSHNHPMFGAVAAYLFDFILGIRESDTSLTYEKIEIQPKLTKLVKSAKGHRTLKQGEVFVSYEKLDTGTHFVIKIPRGLEASFRHGETVFKLAEGENDFYL